MAYLTDRERQWAGNQFGVNNMQTTEEVDRAYAAREADRKREERLRQEDVIGGRYNDDPEPSQLACVDCGFVGEGDHHCPAWCDGVGCSLCYPDGGAP